MIKKVDKIELKRVVQTTDEVHSLTSVEERKTFRVERTLQTLINNTECRDYPSSFSYLYFRPRKSNVPIFTRGKDTKTLLRS